MSSIMSLNRRFRACENCPLAEEAQSIALSIDLRPAVTHLEIAARGERVPDKEDIDNVSNRFELPGKIGELAWQCAQAKANGTCNK